MQDEADPRFYLPRRAMICRSIYLIDELKPPIHIKTLGSILFLIVFSFPIFAQEILVERLSVDDGLSQSDIRCMTQDKFGFLWVGTRDGLNRYDGSTFEQFHFTNRSPSGLAFNQIHSLITMDNGDLVIGSVGGFSIFKQADGTFENIFFPDINQRGAIVTDIAMDSNIICLATTAGVLSYDLALKRFIVIDDYQRFAGDNVSQIQFDKTFGVWIGTTRGLYRMLPGEKEFSLLMKDTLIQQLNFNTTEVFISTDRGLFHYTNSQLRNIPLPRNFKNVTAAHRASNGEIWVASHQVLILSDDGQTIKHILAHQDDNYRSLSEDRARVLYETRDDLMWIGTFGYGLNKHDPHTREIRYFGSSGKLQLSSPYVSAIYSSDDTVIYVGASRGVNIIDLKNQRNTVFNPYAGSTPEKLFLVYAIRETSEGHLWMACADGLYALRDNHFTTQNVRLGEIVDFIEFDSRTLLLLTRISGCYLFDKTSKQVSKFIESKELLSDQLTVRMNDEEIWIGAVDGIRIFNKKGDLMKHHVSIPNDPTSLPSNVIKSLNEDSDGNMWVGTWGGGLSVFNDNTQNFTTFSVTDGLPSNVVYGSLESNEGLLWMSTNSGISAFDRKTMVFTNFELRDGLQSNEFNTGAYFKSRYGRMYFGGINGFNSFDPARVLEQPQVSQVQVKGVTREKSGAINYEARLGQSDPIALNWDENTITLHLAITDFRMSHKYKLQYAINDGPWNMLGNARRIDLSELAPGDYTIKTRTSIRENSWLNETTLIELSVETPFWRQPWAAALFLIGVIGFLYMAQRVRLMRLTKRNELLDRLVLTRTRQVQEKSDEIVAQNEELQSQADELSEKNTMLEKNRAALLDFQKELESRVNQRTRDIQDLNVKLIKQNTQLEQFSFITAHNFKGPIARIKGLVNLLSTGPISEDDFKRVREYLERSIDDLDKVTHDLNTILHIRNTSPADLTEIPLRQVVDEVVSKLASEIQISGVVLDIQFESSTNVLGVHAFVHSIFYILLDNAIKYRTQQSVPIVTLIGTESSETILVDIIDNGIGIDMNLAGQKIFNIYQRFNYAPGGRGLGLYMVKTQMEMMGGEVAVESELGKGTKFRLAFKKFI